MDTTNVSELLSLSRAARAIDATEKARAVEGLYATGHWLLGNERHKDAADVFRAMCVIAREDERGWVGLGMAHEGADQHEVAKEIYAAGCTLAKDNGRCSIALVRALRRLGEADAASAILDDIDVSADADLEALVAHERRVA